MTMPRSIYSYLAVGALLWPLNIWPASAQGPGPGFMMGPGMMRGPQMWGGRFAGPCDPGAAGIAEWRIDRIESVIKPTDAQRAALNDLRSAHGIDKSRGGAGGRLPERGSAIIDGTSCVHGKAHGCDAAGDKVRAPDLRGVLRNAQR